MLAVVEVDEGRGGAVLPLPVDTAVTVEVISTVSGTCGRTRNWEKQRQAIRQTEANRGKPRQDYLPF